MIFYTNFKIRSKIVFIEISETSVEVLPRLFKIKYDSGTLQELLYVDMPHEYENTSGQIVLDYTKAIQESVFEQLHVVRDGHLRLTFSSDLKVGRTLYYIFQFLDKLWILWYNFYSFLLDLLLGVLCTASWGAYPSKDNNTPGD